MVLAAGRGERLRPLTDALPKPLLTVGGRPLIVYHLERLARLGVREVVINLSWLGGADSRAALGDGAAWTCSCATARKSRRSRPVAAFSAPCPGSGPAPFLVVNADIFTDLDFAAV